MPFQRPILRGDIEGNWQVHLPNFLDRPRAFVHIFYESQTKEWTVAGYAYDASWNYTATWKSIWMDCDLESSRIIYVYRAYIFGVRGPIFGLAVLDLQRNAEMSLRARGIFVDFGESGGSGEEEMEKISDPLDGFQGPEEAKRMLQSERPHRSAGAVASSSYHDTVKVFLSYNHFANHHERGYIGQLCEQLAGEARMLGIHLEIFNAQGIPWGEPWRPRIDKALQEAHVFIPLLTPGFFTSPECRRELEVFLKREESLGRNNLILPIYYVECPVLEFPDMLEWDALAGVLASRQYVDWRDLRGKPFRSARVRSLLTGMAKLVEERARQL